MTFALGEKAARGHLAGELDQGTGLSAQHRIESREDAPAKFEGVFVALRELAIDGVSPLLVALQITNLGLERDVRLAQLRVELLGLGLKFAIVRDEVVPLHGVADRGDEILAEPGFGDEAENFPLVDRIDDRRQREDGRDENARAVRAQPPAFDEKIQAEHFRHPLIGENHGEIAIREDGQRLVRARAGDDVKALALERGLQGLQHDQLVIDDENRRWLARGRSRWVGGRRQWNRGELRVCDHGETLGIGGRPKQKTRHRSARPRRKTSTRSLMR